MRLFLLLLTLCFFGLNQSTYAALTLGGTYKPCKSEGYSFENGTYVFNYTNTIAVGGGTPDVIGQDVDTTCRTMSSLGTQKILQTDGGLLLTNTGIYILGKGVTYIDFAVKFGGMSLLMLLLYVLLYLSEKIIRKSKNNIIGKVIISILFIVLLGYIALLTPEALAGCAGGLRLYFDEQIILAISLLFIFSFFFLLASTESKSANFNQLKPPIYISVALIVSYGIWEILDATDIITVSNFAYLIIIFIVFWIYIHILIIKSYLWAHKGFLSGLARLPKVFFYIFIIIFVLNILPRFTTLCY